jgi:hypothetical protein
VRNLRFASVLPLLALAACAVTPGSPSAENTGANEEAWDSQSGNPTHATHSYLTEYAVDHLSAQYPELATYKATIVKGANEELHELPISGDADLESLREAADGTNWSCNHPEVIWQLAQQAYESGNKDRAYFLTGIVLHWVEDMGVPAHAFHVIHQGTLTQADNFEILGLQRWSPLFDIQYRDPGYYAPSDYLNVSSQWAQNDFHQTFPGQTYTRSFFSISWLWASSTQAHFVQEREGRTATVATWALRAAVQNF